MANPNLTNQQMEAVNLYLSRKANGMTVEQVAEGVGVTRRTLLRWRSLPAWQVYESEQAMTHARSHLSDVMTVLVEKALGGHPKAIELYLKAVHVLGNDAKPVVAQPEDDPRSTESMEAELAELQRMLDEINGESNQDANN